LQEFPRLKQEMPPFRATEKRSQSIFAGRFFGPMKKGGLWRISCCVFCWEFFFEEIDWTFEIMLN
jgi:hypothetical protein